MNYIILYLKVLINKIGPINVIGVNTPHFCRCINNHVRSMGFKE
jgi:hypothetical protein